MSFFQNPFSQEFRGSLVLGDRAYIPNFVIAGNSGRGDGYVVAWNTGPYNLSGTDSDGNNTNTLTISFSLDANNFANWTSLTFTLTTGAVSTSAVTSAEVVASLNADSTFTNYFTASVDTSVAQNKPLILIKQKQPNTRFKFFVVNGTGEEVLRFNDRAGVAELPTYFSRHEYNKINTYSDCVSLLIPLNPATASQAYVINNAKDFKGKSLGLSSGTVKADWQIMAGRSGIFTFKKQTVDASSRITQIIEYSAGAVAGDLAKKTTMSYTAAKTSPDQIAEVPYTLTSGDLITP